MLIPPNRMRSLSSPTCLNSMMCSQNLLQDILSSTLKHRRSLNNLKSLPPLCINGSESISL